MAQAIATMQVRGAPLIGVAAAYGIALAMLADPSEAALENACLALLATRPTAVNLRWSIDRVRGALRGVHPPKRAQTALAEAARIADEDVAINEAIGEHALPLFERIAALRPDRPINILTHCNAGWLATVDRGTATAGIYLAHDAGLPLRVWVDETRPRNQGASLTAWELEQHGVPYVVVADNAGGHLMQQGMIDVVIVGTDRTTARGDVCNKIGTYLKALAAHDNSIPFYVAAPSPSIDFNVDEGTKEIPIEERSGDEVSYISGEADDGTIARVRLVPRGARVVNHGFDVTPARLVTGLITERGVSAATREGLAAMFPERTRAVRDAAS